MLAWRDRALKERQVIGALGGVIKGRSLRIG